MSIARRYHEIYLFSASHSDKVTISSHVSQQLHNPTLGGVKMSSRTGRVLVTGGAGFIGSSLTEELVKRGNKVIAIDIGKDPANLSRVLGKVNYINGDVRDRQLMKMVMSEHEFDGVVHLAAVSRVIWGEQDPDRCVDVNVKGTATVLEVASEMKCPPWIVFGSSREVYGEPSILPVREDHPKNAMNVYGRAKVEGEQLVRKYVRNCQSNGMNLRFSNTYGNERDILDRVIPNFILSALRGQPLNIHGGGQVFDFTHIDDVVGGILNATDYLRQKRERAECISEDVHLSTGKGTSLEELVRIISDSLGNMPEVVYSGGRKYDVENFVGDPTKAREVIGFSAKLLPHHGVPRTIKRFKEAFGL